MESEASLDATLFYRVIVRYRPEDKPALLAFQREAALGSPWVRGGLRLAGQWVQRRLERDLDRVLSRR